MRFPGFLGGSYESQALTADCSRTVNWFPEVLQDKDATVPATLLPTPGVERIDTELAYKVQPGRAHIFINGREFAILGRYLVEFSATGSCLPAGAVRGDLGLPGDEPATISSNGDGGNQLFITSNGNAWSYDLASNALTSVAALTGLATMGAYLDGYFLCLDSNTSTLYISALMDGATWTPGTDFAQRSLAPDKWVSMCVVGRNLWLFGTQTSEVWYDSGGTFPLAPHPSGLINLGCAAQWTPKVLGAEVVWLATSRAGHVCVARASGFSPSIISTYPMETAFQTYKSIGMAVADSYSSDGHTFYVLNFDTAGATWVWDSATTLWCERGEWVPSLMRFTAWRPRFYAHAFGEHRVLDAGGPGLFRMASTITRDMEGNVIRRLRRAPAIMSENKRVFYSSFEVDLEPGLGPVDPVTPPLELVDWVDGVQVNYLGAGSIESTWAVDGTAVAYSSQRIVGAGSAQFEWLLAYSSGLKASFGLITASRFLGAGVLEYEYGFMVDTADRLWTVEGGVATDTAFDLIADTILSIHVSAIGGGTVSFYRGSTLISTAVAPTTLEVLRVKGVPYTGTIAGPASVAYAQMCTGVIIPSENPQVMLRLSNDGGRTWLSEEMRGAGKIGEYLTRVRWNRLGAARRRVFEVVVTDDVPWRLTGAYLESSLGAKQA